MKRLKEIEKEYGVDFGQHGNMTLAGYLKKAGFSSLAKLVKRVNENQNHH